MIHVIICSVLASWGVYSILCCIEIAYIIEDKCFAGDGGSVYSRLWHGKGNQADSPPIFYDCFADFKKKFHWLLCSCACQRWKKQSSVDKPCQNRNFFPVKRRHVDRWFHLYFDHLEVQPVQSGFYLTYPNPNISRRRNNGVNNTWSRPIFLPRSVSFHLNTPFAKVTYVGLSVWRIITWALFGHLILYLGHVFQSKI